MPAARCFRCGFEGEISEELCRYCGAELTGMAASASQNQEFNHGETLAEFPPVPDVERLNGVGTVLGPTLSVFTNNIWLVTKLVVVIFAPFELFRILSFSRFDVDRQTYAVTNLLQLVCAALVAPSLIYAFYVVMRTGSTPGVNESLRFGLSRIGKLCIAAAIAWVLTMVGFTLLIIPGIILGVIFELVFPIATLENLSPIEILKRSYRLTKGHRLTIFLSTLVMWLLCAVLTGPLTWVTTMLFVSGTMFWPVNVAIAILIDIVNESRTVLSLMIFLSIAPYTKMNSHALPRVLNLNSETD